jgi:glutaredoxin
MIIPIYYTENKTCLKPTSSFDERTDFRENVELKKGDVNIKQRYKGKKTMKKNVKSWV